MGRYLSSNAGEKEEGPLEETETAVVSTHSKRDSIQKKKGGYRCRGKNTGRSHAVNERWGKNMLSSDRTVPYHLKVKQQRMGKNKC